MVETADVDVVNMSIGGLPALNDGNNTRAVLYNRLIEDNNTQMFISAGNSGPGENTIGDPAVATKVMAVGAYITKETWQRDYGPTPTSWTTSIRSAPAVPPRTARSSRRSSRPARRSRASRPGRSASRSVARTRCRPGTACSTARRWRLPSRRRGSAAAQRREGQGLHAFGGTARNAFNSTARFIPGYNAADQGNGLIDVNRAWDLYKDGPETVNITSRVAVHTILSSSRSRASARASTTARASRSGSATPGRTRSPARPARTAGALPPPVGRQRRHVRHAEQPAASPQRADDGQRAGQPVDDGIHSAILRLDNSSTDGIDYETMNTVIVPDELTAANGFSVTKTGWPAGTTCSASSSACPPAARCSRST